MKTRILKFAIITVGLICLVVAIVYISSLQPAVLYTAGPVAQGEKQLIIISLALSLLVVIPVFLMTAIFAVRYQETKTATYSPDWDRNPKIEALWWIIPSLIILFLGYLAWTSSHKLDPHRRLNSTSSSLRVQVVSLQWKWLFIYPDQGIATVNYLKIPTNTEINFELTSDAPMNSFWIPELGGQIYTMSGMTTNLHLLSENPGIFRGSSANLSGQGFANMNFPVQSMTKADFANWSRGIGTGSAKFDFQTYAKLSEPGTVAKSEFSLSTNKIYEQVLAKYTGYHDHMEMTK